MMVGCKHLDISKITKYDLTIEPGFTTFRYFFSGDPDNRDDLSCPSSVLINRSLLYNVCFSANFQKLGYMKQVLLS